MSSEKSVVVSSPPPPGDGSIAGLLHAAILKGDSESIKTLAEIYERWQDKQAEREFNEALSEFQGECPIILKKKLVEFPTKSGGKFTSRYAEMDTIVEDTRELRCRHGFSHTFDREVSDTRVSAWCVLRHRAGHQTRTPFSVPMPKEIKLSEAHTIAGLVTFCERYAFRGALGITTGLDNDGKEFTTNNETISPGQVDALQKLIEETGSDGEAFWRFARVQRLEDLPLADFPRVQQALFAKRGKQKGVQ